MLVVEVASPSTRRRAREHKRRFYMDVGVPEYWIVDADTRSLTAVRSGQAELVAKDACVWAPAGAATGLEVKVPMLFE